MSTPPDHSKFVDGYVFYKSRTSWKKVCQLWQDGTVRYAVKNLSGPDEIIAFIGELPGPNAHAKRAEKMDKAEKAANPTFSSATSTLITVSAPSRWSPKRPFAAHLRIKADPGTEQALYDEFNPDDPGHIFTREQGYNGHALCHGKWDVLVELGADSPQDLDALVAIARNAPHVKSMIVTTAAMPPSQPDPPATCEDWK